MMSKSIPEANVSLSSLLDKPRAERSSSSESSEIDLSYLRASRFTRFYRGVVAQMIFLGALSFVGPAMSDAISNLGGGGLPSPYLANLANSLNYVLSCLMTLLGGPLINKIGIKYSCVIAAIAMPLTGLSYYVTARYGGIWYLLIARMIDGIASGFLYMAETTAMISYPKQSERGFYLAIWSAMRNSGSIIGGGIAFSLNINNSASGGMAPMTYLVFAAFEVTGIIWAVGLSPTKLVRRSDGIKIPIYPSNPWKQEFIALWQYTRKKQTWLIFLPAFYSFFYGGTMGSYLVLRFSVRARAFASLITPTLTVPLVIAYGRLVLDSKRWSQRRRAKIAFIIWVIPQLFSFTWIGIEYVRLGKTKAAFDYAQDTKHWAEAFLPYLIIFMTGYLTQLSLYWIISTFSHDTNSSSRISGLFRSFETMGQAISYGLNSSSHQDPRVGFVINCVILLCIIPCMNMLIQLVPGAPRVKGTGDGIGLLSDASDDELHERKED
ncbi:hypothetical protein K3495_g7145 [Podosphaera aphanis]|nr:hypothetical protein K3495_g7145 [Podosphaera aphanis]